MPSARAHTQHTHAQHMCTATHTGRHSTCPSTRTHAHSTRPQHTHTCTQHSPPAYVHTCTHSTRSQHTHICTQHSLPAHAHMHTALAPAHAHTCTQHLPQHTHTQPLMAFPVSTFLGSVSLFLFSFVSTLPSQRLGMTSAQLGVHFTLSLKHKIPKSYFLHFFQLNATSCGTCYLTLETREHTSLSHPTRGPARKSSVQAWCPHASALQAMMTVTLPFASIAPPVRRRDFGIDGSESTKKRPRAGPLQAKR